MKKVFFVLVGVVITVVVIVLFFISGDQITIFETVVNTNSYAEYQFDSGDDLDLGFTKRAYDKLQETQSLLDEDSDIVLDKKMAYSPLSEQDMSRGIVSRYVWEDDRYEVVQDAGWEAISGKYRMLLNDELLFEEQMDYGADGPIQDWRIVGEKPAFTFRSAGEVSDVWYDGDLISEKINVSNPRYLFSYNNKIGFVASNNGSDAIFYDGKFITLGFDIIWTHNCCSYAEILPTIYENGTLLFFAKRGEVNYLVEVRLK